jgi:hypothetical protein
MHAGEMPGCRAWSKAEINTPGDPSIHFVEEPEFYSLKMV